MSACVTSSLPAPVAALIDDQAPRIDDHPRRSKSPYKVLTELGSGLHGRVLRATDLQSQRDVAVKLPAELTVDAMVNDTVSFDTLDKQVASIVHECNAMSRVQHRNVLQVHRLVPGCKLGFDYVAMVTGFAPNGDLFDMLDIGGALPEALVKVYTSQLLHALQACHANGVVHRDVKPENLLLDANYELKLCDFGVAAVAPVGADASDVVSKDESGTMMYMAPEVRARRAYRAMPVDVWSAGVVLFILMTGLPPFNDAQQGDVWYDYLLDGDLENFWATQPDDVAESMTPGAQDLISMMLNVDPEQRITVVQALQHPWLQGVGQVEPTLLREKVSEYLHFAATD